MKSICILSVFCALLMYSCNWNKNDDDPVKLDKIDYQDFNPDITLSTIREYYTSPNPFCDQLPLPNDSSAFYELDLDKDGYGDFRFTILHYQQDLTQYCGHCGIFHIKQLKIKPASTDCYISLDSASRYWARCYDTTGMITSTHFWSGEETIGLFLDGCMTPSIGFSDTYFGLKKGDKLGWAHLQRSGHNGIIVLESAFNRTNGNGIRPGQKD